MRYSVASVAAGKTNLDRYFIDLKRSIFLVCDGTTAGGEFSYLFTDWLLELLERNLAKIPRRVKEAETFYRDFLEYANWSLTLRLSDHYGGQLNPWAMGVGCTFTLVHKIGKNWLIVNIGDSPVFLIRNGRVRELTYSDNEFNQLVESGQIAICGSDTNLGITTSDIIEEDRALLVSRLKRNLVNWLGNCQSVHTKVVPSKSGDVLVLCTDGFSNSIRRENLVFQTASVREGFQLSLLHPIFTWLAERNEEGKQKNKLFDDATALMVWEG